MARTSFSRTVVKTICDVRYVDTNNDIQKTTVILWGNYDIDHAYTPCQRKLGAKGIIIDSIKHESYYGTQTLQEFDKHCTKTDYKEW